MNCEIVTLKEKAVAGYSARTNNASPDMGKVIGELWQRFYSDGGYPSIPEKINGKAHEIYTDYEADEKADYTVMVACETRSAYVPEGFEIRTIPAGRYAKFIVKGNMMTAAAEFWQKLWKMDLDRSFVCDFEEYQNNDCENAEIHIYIGLR